MNEAKVHEHLCEYTRMQYPKEMFNSDLSGVKLPMGLAVKVKKLRSNRGFPDFMLYRAKGGYHGFFLELKADGVRLWKKNGDWASEHLREQSEVIHELNKRGYYARFAVGFEDAKAQVDAYMRLK